MKEKLLALVGPTAVGKTQLSIALAKRFQAEIISGDSMQVYKGMDIGTAKIKVEEQEGIVHHLLDILNPDEDYSVVEFQQMAMQLITALNAKGRLPLLVGGTGLYVQAVTHHFSFTEAHESSVIRERWEAFAQQYGALALHRQLAQKDPQSAEQIHPHNSRRVIRALEVLELTGKSIADYRNDWFKASPYDLVMIGLTMERKQLYERINERVDEMIRSGLIEETQKLMENGISEHATALQAIGYKEVIQYLKGHLSRDEALELLKRNTRRYAKRQLTWFRRMKEIQWFDVGKYSKQALLEKITAKIEGEWNHLENI